MQKGFIVITQSGITFKILKISHERIYNFNYMDDIAIEIEMSLPPWAYSHHKIYGIQNHDFNSTTKFYSEQFSGN
jgi:hypothetical protein